VNEITIGNAATGNNPSITPSGGDSNIGLDFNVVGTGVYNFKATSSNAIRQRWFEDTDNGTNYLEHQTPSSIASNRTIAWPDTDISGFVVQRVSTMTGAVATGTTTTPWDDTIPQNTEGNQVMTLAITPKSTSNILVIDVCVNVVSNPIGDIITALFQDTTANALAAVSEVPADVTRNCPTTLRHIMSAGTTSSTTFKVRCGSSAAGTLTFNGSASARKLGGVMASSIMITEYSI